MNVCFFISDFWWNRLPQYWQGYGLVSEWMRRCVDKVDDLLKLLSQILQLKTLSCWKNVISKLVCSYNSGWIIQYCDNASIGPTCEWTALCCSRLTAWPNVFPQISHAKGLVPLCDRRTWTSSPWGVENTCLKTKEHLEVFSGSVKKKKNKSLILNSHLIAADMA